MYDTLIGLFAALVKSGLPLAIVLLALLAARCASRQHRPVGGMPASTRWLLLLCAGVWVMVLGEHLTHGRVAAFDTGAPLAMLVGLLTVPWLLPLCLLQEVRHRAPWLRLSLLCLSGMMALLPGALMLWFYAAGSFQGG